jgi:hypothetical protein
VALFWALAPRQTMVAVAAASAILLNTDGHFFIFSIPAIWRVVASLSF